MTNTKSKDRADKPTDSFTESVAEGFTDDLKKVLETLDENEDVVKMKKQAKQVADVTAEFIREYPIQTVVGAAVVGLAVGYLMGRRK